MKRTIANINFGRPLFTLLFALLSSTSGADHNMKTYENSDETKVLSTINTMTTAFKSKDIKGIFSTYEEGAAVMFEPGKAVSDLKLLKQMFGEAFKINPQFSYPKGHEVYIANDIALHIAPWDMEATAPDGTTISESGLSVAVLRKQAEGQWLMVLDNPYGQFLLNN